MPALEVTARALDGRTVVSLRGELDIAVSDDLRRQIRAARREHGDHVVLDMESLEFMDSHGLSVIISCYKSVTAAGGSLTLAGPRPIIRRTLEITGLHRRFRVLPTLAEAIAPEPEPERA
ncbi:STAS domain-containing protein [Actinomadura fibrosa]|uniref:Anti-sigma factor antagonist n=1 Tax=Actinomadura fibrosa TaxID=111802 RepID=A0ABW2XZJ9_9ACTN|nr:STAS domain-containing protein [Actinomadura fibrosa]